MKRKEAIAHGKEQLEIFGGEHKEFIKLALEALEQEPCEDAISRKTIKAIPLEKFKEMDKEVRNYFATTFYPSLSGVLMILHKHVELIDSPTREHGEWIANYDAECDDHGNYPIECSVCGACGGREDFFPNFCHKCGADMRKVKTNGEPNN